MDAQGALGVVLITVVAGYGVIFLSAVALYRFTRDRVKPQGPEVSLKEIAPDLFDGDYPPHHHRR